jgi:hypothetical protein
MVENNRGTHIWRGVEENANPTCSNVKTACTANESMRQNHLQIKAAHHLINHQGHNTLNFPGLNAVGASAVTRGIDTVSQRRSFIVGTCYPERDEI